MCAGFHVRRAPCLPGSCAQGYTLARFHAYRVPCLPGSMLTGFQLRWVPRIPGSICYRFLYTGLSCVGFQACRVQFAPSSCAKGSTCDELQPRRAPTTPDSNHAGSMLTGFYVLWIIVCCIVLRVLCRIISICYFLVVLSTRIHTRLLCLSVSQSKSKKKKNWNLKKNWCPSVSLKIQKKKKEFHSNQYTTSLQIKTSIFFIPWILLLCC